MKRYIFFILFACLSFTFTGCFSIGDSGEAGVYVSASSGTDMNDTAGEGFNMHGPFTDVNFYNLREQNRLENMNVLDASGLDVDLEISIIFSPSYRPGGDKTILPRLQTTFGMNYYEQKIQPEFRSVVREEVGKYTSEQLYATGRGELQEGMLSAMRENVPSELITIHRVLIRDVKLPRQIQQAIKNKLKEEQEAQRYEYTLQKERLEAERKRIAAEADAEANRIRDRSLTDAVLKAEQIQAFRELTQGEAKVYIMPGENGNLLLGTDR